MRSRSKNLGAEPPRRQIDASQVDLMFGSILETLRVVNPEIPRAPREAIAFGLLHEIMYAAGLRFADHEASNAGTPFLIREGGDLNRD